MKTPHILLSILLLFAAPFHAFAKNGVKSPYAAELLLLFAASEYHLANENHAGKYYVGGAIDRGDYFQIDLRRTDETLPSNWVGSDLAGWFGVRKKDGVIVEWNVAEDIPGNLIERVPNKTAIQLTLVSEPGLLGEER